MVEVVALAGALADSGEHRVAAVLDRDVTDQFHHVDGLADAGAAEQADLAALGERAEQVDDLDAGFQQFAAARLLLEGGGRAVDRHALFALDGAGMIDGVAEHVHDAAQGLLADRHRDRRTGVFHFQPAAQSVGRSHGNSPHHAVAELLLDLQRQVGLCHRQCVIDLRHGGRFEFHVHDRADDFYDLSRAHESFGLLLIDRFRLYGSGSADDFRDFLGDRRLSRLVVDQL